MFFYFATVKIKLCTTQVDFLRRRVEVLRQDVEGKEQVGVQVAAVRAIVDRLDDRLTGALARLGLVENTTKTLEKRSAPHYENLPSSYLMNAADRPPTLTVYPEPRQGKKNYLHTMLSVSVSSYKLLHKSVYTLFTHKKYMDTFT